MVKNLAGQKVQLFAFDSATNLPASGDAANLTAYVQKDGGAVTVLADTSAAELDATNAKGWYQFDVAQGESNANDLLFTGKSVTSGIVVVARAFTTTPANFGLMALDASGRVDLGLWIGSVPLALSSQRVQAEVLDGLAVNLTTIKGFGITLTGPVTMQSGTWPIVGDQMSLTTAVRPGMRRSVAFSAFPFLMTDTVFHNPAIALTVTAQRSLDGAALANGSLAVTELSNGIYLLSGAAGDTNAAFVGIRCTAPGADDLFFTIPTTP